MIYLDNAATTYPKPECVYKTLDFYNRHAFNAGRGSYKGAMESQKLMENTRNKILEIGGIKQGNVIYTCSATMALNNIIFGLNLKEGDYIYISPFEHNSIVRPLEDLRKRLNIKIEVLPFDKDTWEPDVKKINDLFIMHQPSAVFLSQVSNVTGLMLNYQKIFELSKKYNCINVLDSSQCYGIIKIDNCELIDYIVFAGHKSLYGSFGIGGYIKIGNDKLNHTIFGGTGSDTMNHNMSDKLPDGYEAGSQNIVAIASLDSSIDWLKNINILEHEKELTQYLIKKLNNLRNVKVYKPLDENNVFGVVSISVNNYLSSDVGKILDDEFSICVRTGYHCAPLVHDFLKSKDSNGTVRISLSYFNTKDDIDKLILALKSL